MLDYTEVGGWISEYMMLGRVNWVYNINRKKI